MIESHQGCVRLANSFNEVYNKLMIKRKRKLSTSTGTLFIAEANTARDGRLVIRFFQDGSEYARCYPCCWGHYYNCNRTRIGMYCKALDNSVD